MPRPGTWGRPKPRGTLEVVRHERLQFIPHSGWASLPEPENAHRITIAQVQAEVARFYRIAPDDMKAAKRHWTVSHPRQVAMALARELTRSSLPDIGRRFGGRDHTTVIHAVRAVEARAKRDAELRGDLAKLRERLAG